MADSFVLCILLNSIHTLLQCTRVTNILITFYCKSTQHTAPQVHFVTVPQRSHQCRNGNSSTATYCNADAVKYEQSFIGECKVASTDWKSMGLTIDQHYIHLWLWCPATETTLVTKNHYGFRGMACWGPLHLGYSIRSWNYKISFNDIGL